MKKEVKIALVAILGIVLLFFGMQFLKGLNLFSSDTAYQIKFSDISGLSSSSPVYANGYRVGTIRSIDYDFSQRGDITVLADINSKMQIPQGTRAEISSDLLGNVQVNLLLPENATTLLQPGDVIDGRINDGALGEMKSMVPALQGMLPKLDSIMGSLNRLLADPALAASLHNVQQITADLTTSTQQLNQLLASVNKEFPSLAAKTDGLLANTDDVMTQASNAVGAAQRMVNTLNSQIGAIDVAATMSQVDQTLANVQQLTDRLNSNQGTLGLLMNDNTLYDNLTQTMRHADSLVVNLREHPKRYVHFSVFGKKDK